MDIKKLFPPNLQNDELFKELAEILQYFEDEHAQEFKDIFDKYRDPFGIDQKGAQTIIDELGYTYITDIVLSLSDQELGTLVTYMGFISLMKGHRKGLETVFDLLGFEYELTEWWEYKNGKDISYQHEPDKKKYLQPDEFKLVINLLASSNIQNIFYTLPKLREFVENYVYPKLQWLETIFADSFLPIGIDANGFTDKMDQGINDALLASITGKGVIDAEEFGSIDLDPTSQLPEIENNILLESLFSLRLEDNSQIKLEG